MKWVSFIHLKNYKQHTDLRLDFTRGVNILRGESDVGKSTVLKALRKCLLNVPDRKAASFLSWGAPRGAKTEIFVGIKDNLNGTIDDDDAGETIIHRTMGKTANEYGISYPGSNEEIVYSGFGKTVPAEIMEAHGFRLVDMGYGKEALNFIDQFDGFFLISKSPEEIAVALGRLAHTEVIENVRDGIRSDISKNTRLLNETKSYIKEKGTELEKYVFLEDEAQLIVLAESCLDAIEKIEARIEAIEKIERAINQSARKIEGFELLITDKTDYAKAIGLLQKADASMQTHKDIYKIESAIIRSSDRIESAQRKINSMPDFPKVYEKLNASESSLNLYNQVRTLAFSIAKSSKALVGYSEIAAQAFDSDAFAAAINKATVCLNSLDKVGKASRKIELASENLRGVNKRLDSITAKLESLACELKEQMEGKCPLCGQDVAESDLETIKAHIS